MVRDLDWQLLVGVGVIAAAGLLSLSAADTDLFSRQLAWFGIGSVLAAMLFFFDWRPFLNYRGMLLGIYIIFLLLLIATLFAAPIRGTRAWLSFSGFQFQPSEFMKIILILLYANFFRHAHVSIARPLRIIQSLIYVALPIAIITLEPDMGSALTLVAIWFGFLLVSGIRWRHLFITILIMAIAAVVVWHGALQLYQKERIVGFLATGHDPLGVNYNVIQSKIAVGSAGWWGKGYAQGTQSRLGFLPEAKTDFIFAAFIEEWGIIAGLILVTAFIFVIFRVVALGLRTHNNFNRFLCLGAVIYWTTQFALNVGSTIGLVPVVGITFPFLSYGGSSILTNMALLGMIESVAARRSLSA
ncbi:rod shape-determining protein RodA [Candidatus Wolfebacteria bacterium]|nr:rod shape-determining protein RodA [Candidatus Wolfebacteria bacterium]